MARATHSTSTENTLDIVYERRETCARGGERDILGRPGAVRGMKSELGVGAL